jgi:hypothetical protein
MNPNPRCDDCGRDWLERPSAMFHDHIWKAMGVKREAFLCAYCANRRLFRECKFNRNEAGGDHLHSVVQGDWRLK